MSLYSRIAPRGRSGFGYGSTAEEVTAGLSLAGRTVLVTGVGSGLGAETARVLALRGARVVGTARRAEQAAAALASLGSGHVGLSCELAEPASVRACAAAAREVGPLDAIVCNAGVMALPTRQVAHGWELQLLTNHLGHFVLVTGLLDRLAEGGRVVVVSSSAHFTAPRPGVAVDDLSCERGYVSWLAYSQSKFANLLFAKELARRLAGSGRVAMAIHPGVIRTPLFRHMSPFTRAWFAAADALSLKSVPEGAATQVYAAVHPDAAAHHGAYLANCNVAWHRPDADDPELARRLWEVSEAAAARL